MIIVLSVEFFRFEAALIEISHYHGDSVQELIDIAYKARHWKYHG